MRPVARLEVRVEDHPSPADLAKVDDALDAATIRAAGNQAPQVLAVFARSAGGAVVGAAHGWTWAGCAEVVSFWVADGLRRRGVGDALLRAAEAEALARGCRQVLLFTHGDGVPHVYARAGYGVVGEVGDYPVGTRAYWLRKRLDEPPTTAIDRLVQNGVLLAIAFVLARDLVDDATAVGRRATASIAQWWSVLERRERKGARQTEMAFMATRVRVTPKG